MGKEKIDFITVETDSQGAQEKIVEVKPEKFSESVPGIKSEDNIRKMNSDELAVENEYKKSEIADAKIKQEEKSDIEKFSESIQEFIDEIDNDDKKAISNGRIIFIKGEIEKYDINRNLYVLEERLKELKSDGDENSERNSIIVKIDEYKDLKEKLNKVNDYIQKKKTNEIEQSKQPLNQQEGSKKIEEVVDTLINGLSKEQVDDVLVMLNSDDENVRSLLIKILKERFSDSGLDFDNEDVVKSITDLTIKLGKKRLEEIEAEGRIKGSAEGKNETATNPKEEIQTVKETVRESQMRILGERIKALDVEGSSLEKAQTRLKVAEEKLRNFQDREGMKEIIAKAHGSIVLSENEAIRYREYVKLDQAVSQESLGLALAYARLLSLVDPKDIYEVAAEARRKSAQELYGNLQNINGLIENQKRIFGECDPKTRESVSRFKDVVLSDTGQENKAAFTDLNKIKDVDEFNAMIPEIDKQLKSRAGKMPFSNKKSNSKTIRNNLKDFAILSKQNLSDENLEEIVTDIKGLRENIKDKKSDYAKYADVVLTVMEELITGKGKRAIVEVISSDSDDEGENQRVSEMADFEVIKIIHDKAGGKKEKKMVDEISKFIKNNSDSLENRNLESLIENEAVANKILNELLVLKDSVFKKYVSEIIKERLAKTVAEIKKLEEEKNAEFEGKDVFSAYKIDVIDKPQAGIESRDKIIENNVATSGNETAEVQPNNEIINDEIQNMFRDELTKLKENDVDKFNNLPEFIEAFRTEDGLFGQKFTEDWFRNMFSGNEVGYEELKDKKVKTVVAGLKKIYEEVEAEEGPEEAESAVDLDANEIKEDISGEIKEAVEDASKSKKVIELKNKATMNKYLQDVDKQVLQDLLNSKIKIYTESTIIRNLKLYSCDIEEIIEKTKITMNDKDKKSMELLTFNDLKEVVEEILKTKTSEESSPQEASNEEKLDVIKGLLPADWLLLKIGNEELMGVNTLDELNDSVKVDAVKLAHIGKDFVELLGVMSNLSEFLQQSEDIQKIPDLDRMDEIFETNTIAESDEKTAINDIKRIKEKKELYFDNDPRKIYAESFLSKINEIIEGVK